MHGIKNTRLLTAADELRLGRRIEAGDLAAKDELATSNLRLVYALAARYRGRGVPFEDLVQEGTLGLLRAVEKFDHRRELRFSTYAAWWIRRALHDAAGTARPIRVPDAARRQLAAIKRADDELRRDGAGVPTTAAIAERAGVGEHAVGTLRTVARVTASLDEPVGDGAMPLGELIMGADGSEVWQAAETAETRRDLRALLELLPVRHREVLFRRYGFLADRAESHDEIGARLGIGVERSRQLERQALHWLRSLPDSARISA
jgi:RNA polymerase primary sigma factor